MTTKKMFCYIIILTTSITGLNCRGSHSLTSKEKVFKQIYIDQFRLTYFRLSLKHSFNNSKAIQEIINNDHSGFTEAILTFDDYKLIDSLTKLDNIKMVVDSTEGDMRAEGAQGKRPFFFIIDKIRSKWLDSLAKERYKGSNVKEMYLN
ncbi:MAG: hypothetical protein KGL19_13115 [Bacteroidota bacterium]|nr:hypothetical protein [Bacteroidota bacterium]